MALTEDIISQFVKITNDEKREKKEATVYGEYVTYNGKPHIQMDGSDLLTPVASNTVEANDGERVTALVKDHGVIINGNMTSPSASGERVDKVEIFLNDTIDVAEEAKKAAEEAAQNAANAQTSANEAIQNAAQALIDASYAERVATNYLKLDNYGLMVANMTDTLGKNILIGTSYIDFRDGTTVLASYSANAIDLGKNSTSSVINLCNGLGQILNYNEFGDTYPVLAFRSDNAIHLYAGNASLIVDDRVRNGIHLSYYGNEVHVHQLGVDITGDFYVNGMGKSDTDHVHTRLENTLGGGGDVRLVYDSAFYFRPGDTSTNYFLGGSTYRWRKLYAETASDTSSDMRLKEDFSTDFDRYVSMLDLLDPTSYLLINDSEGRRHVGYIAQKVWKAMIDVGLTETDFAGFNKYMQEEGSVYTYGLAYEEFIPILHAKIKQLEARIEQLENKEVI